MKKKFIYIGSLPKFQSNGIMVFADTKKDCLHKLISIHTKLTSKNSFAEDFDNSGFIRKIEIEKILNNNFEEI